MKFVNTTDACIYIDCVKFTVMSERSKAMGILRPQTCLIRIQFLGSHQWASISHKAAHLPDPVQIILSAADRGVHVCKISSRC